ncbi:MAG: nucleotide exchange factor GrpE [Candidatus Cloacimonadaceae bacterium]|nr:nucleotide exchange factor GrpE [Candidatus Cloacimonadaceae bacterium]MDP3113548.1 nucleotide exchange factor GrpE [Candidatus Cloacimonadaceae bacterium]
MSKKKHYDEQKHKEELEKMAFEEEIATVKAELESTDQLVELDKQCSEWKDKYLRNMAEFDNYRRRSNLERVEWIRLATQIFALEICEVLDNFERALLQLKEDQMEDTFVKGILMIEQQLRGALEKEGVKRIDALGREFDPARHDAIAHIPSEYEENVVAAVIKNGYTMHDKVIRPASVAVSSSKHDEDKN